MDETAGRRRRRIHSVAFKAEAVAACRRPGVSLAAAALERSINSNLLRRWVLEAERTQVGASRPRKAVDPPITQSTDSFVPLKLPAPKNDEVAIRIEARRGSTTLTVLWPRCAAHECAFWLLEVLK
jgi:transposase